MAEAVAATQAAGLEAGATTGVLRAFIQLVDQFRERTAEVERLAAHQETDPSRHAAQISKRVKPAMARLREAGDQIQTHVAADLWPLPTYRDLLFLK
jgi:glutamine synthetase